MAGAATLSEPQVLAHTKRRLFPADDGGDEERAYAVCDTQFATDEWLSGRPIPPAVRERLAPFNHVRVGSGSPDLVGVRVLEADLHISKAGDSGLAPEGEADTRMYSVRSIYRSIVSLDTCLDVLV